MNLQENLYSMIIALFPNKMYKALNPQKKLSKSKHKLKRYLKIASNDGSYT